MNLALNVGPLSETVLLGSPCNFQTYVTNRLAILMAEAVECVGIKCTIFENLSTTTKIESLPFLVLGNPITKSIEMFIHGDEGTDKGVYNPCGETLDLAFLHVMQRAQILITSCFIFGQKKFSCNASNVFLTPKCPIKPPECASKTSKSLIELFGMQSLFSLKRKINYDRVSFLLRYEVEICL